MKRLGLAAGLSAVCAFVLSASASAAEATKTEANPSVKITADLEHTKLLAEKGGEVFARIVLEGVPGQQKAQRLPVALTIIIDDSGSMGGDKIVQARNAALAALETLVAGDHVSVVSFSDGAQVLASDFEIGKADLGPARAVIGRLNGSGGTDMISGLDVGGKQARAMFQSSRNNRVMLLSDGQPNTAVGLEDRVAALAKDGITTTTLGIGRDYNEDLMARLADKGLGNYYFIEKPEQLAGIFDKELKTIASVVAKEAVASIALKAGVEVVEVYGYPTSKGSTVVAIPIGDVYGGRRADILAKLRFPAAKEGDSELLELRVTYHDALAGVARKVNMPLAASFTKDASAVTASAVPAVLEKAEKVRTAEAMEQASAAYARGDTKAAEEIVTRQKANLSSFAAAAPAAYKASAMEFADDLEGVRTEAQKPAADKAVYGKKAKAKARDMKR